MNINFPPKEPCPQVWVKFVEWFEAKILGDEWMTNTSDGPVPVFDIFFRGHQLIHCPFCGVTLDLTRSIYQRHPQVES